MLNKKEMKLDKMLEKKEMKLDEMLKKKEMKLSHLKKEEKELKTYKEAKETMYTKEEKETFSNEVETETQKIKVEKETMKKKDMKLQEMMKKTTMLIKEKLIKEVKNCLDGRGLGRERTLMTSYVTEKWKMVNSFLVILSRTFFLQIRHSWGGTRSKDCPRPKTKGCQDCLDEGYASRR